MALDIFSVFDDHHKVYAYMFFWLTWLIPFLMLTSTSFFIKPVVTCQMVTVRIACSLLKYMPNVKSVTGSAIGMYLIITYISTLNIFGILPFIFANTSHLSLNLCISMPLWLVCVYLAIMHRLEPYIAHICPSGAPKILIPILCVIETISNGVRPITLAVRLTANMTTGHILLTLLGYSAMEDLWTNSAVMAGSSGYMGFELSISSVQGYIFTLLPSVYLGEHPL